MRQTPAWQKIQVQSKQVHKHAWTAGCVCFCKYLLCTFALLVFPPFPVICIQNRLIPPSPSGYSSCACGLQQAKCSTLIATPTVPVCAWPFWERAPGACREWKGLCKFKHWAPSHQDWAWLVWFRQLPSAFPTRQRIPVELFKEVPKCLSRMQVCLFFSQRRRHNLIL